MPAGRNIESELYARFSSKQALFRAIVWTQIERLAESAELSRPTRLPELVEGLKTFANRMLSVSLRGDLLQIYRHIFGESLRCSELGAAAAERTLIGIRRLAAFIRERLVADARPCKDAEGIAEVCILMQRGWLVNVMLTNRKVPAAEHERWVDTPVHALLSARRDW